MSEQDGWSDGCHVLHNTRQPSKQSPISRQLVLSSPTATPQPLVAAQPLQAPRQSAGSSPGGLLQWIAERIVFTIFMCRSTGHDGRDDENPTPGSAQKPC